MMTNFSRSVLVLAALSLAAVPALAADPPAADPWPGYVSGGHYLRNIDWGVSLWGPPLADQQTQSSTAGVLVQYAQPILKGKPGWVITVSAGKIKDDLPADEMLKQSAAQLHQGLGNRVSDVKTRVAEADKAPPLAVGHISCMIGADRNAPDAQPIHRLYVYLKLRPKQYLTIRGETAPGGAEALAGVVDVVARSVAVFDPKDETTQTADAAERAAKLLTELKGPDWIEMVGKGDPQWFKVFAVPQAEVGKTGAKPAAVGWAYSLVSARGANKVASISSTRIVQGDTTVSLYREASVVLSSGEEQIQELTHAVAKDTTNESLIKAYRKGGAAAAGTAAGSTTFDVIDHTTGRPDKAYVARIPSQPYIPVALQDVLRRKLVDQPNKLFGGFTYSGGQIRFATMQFAGVEPLEPNSKTQAARFLIRPATTLPMMLAQTDPAGGKTIKLSSAPDGWIESVNEADVPATDRHELTKSPNW